MAANTLFLHLEGPMQAWGDHQSKFVIRRTAAAPTKSGVIGMLLAAMGVPRPEAGDGWLAKLAAMRMGVRMDSPGVRWWDYHTVGAGMKMRTAAGGSKDGPILTRREYLCDASFLVALQGEPDLVAKLREAMMNPKWTPYLGRKSCPPSLPIMQSPPGEFVDTFSALAAIQWRRRNREDKPPEYVDCLIDWTPSPTQPEAPDDALVLYDVPVSLDPPAHLPTPPPRNM